MNFHSEIASGMICGFLKQIQASDSNENLGFLNLLPIPVFFLDVEGKYMECNQAFCDFMNKTREDIISKTVVEVNPSPVYKNYFESDKNMISKGQPFDIIERMMIRGDGEWRNITIYKSLLTKKRKSSGIVGILFDITDLKKAQSREEFYKEKLASIASAFEAVREQERSSIAQEMHDTISQNLAISKLKLKPMLQMQIDDAVKTEIKSVLASIDKALQYTRTMTFDLGISTFTHIGLSSALQWLFEEFKRNHSFSVKAVINLPDELDDRLKAFIFRSANELLTNVIKHSGEKEAELAIFIENENIVLKVFDKGKGIDAYSTKRKDFADNSYGLISLETMACSMGGGLDIKSERGKGTDVALTLPLRNS